MSDGNGPHDQHDAHERRDRSRGRRARRPRLLHLATEGGREIWLDLSTGCEVERPAAPPRTDEAAVYPADERPADAIERAEAA